MITAPTKPAEAPETTVVETAGRHPLMLLVGSAVCWLVISGLLALAGLIQLLSPGFLAGHALLSYGHMSALAQTAFVYGWVGNAGFAFVLWMLGRLSAEPLRAPNWVIAGTSFWNLGLLLGLIGIAFGGDTAIPYLHLPRAVLPIMLIAYAAIAVSGVLAWTGRRRDQMYAAQWYAVAALFLFPWIFSAAQMMLVWAPVRGVLQAVTADWFAQDLSSLWAAPLALSAAYYLVPRITGKVLPSYDVAVLGFWFLIFIGGFTGGRHLIGGPTPAWIGSVGVVTSFILLFHYLIVFLNLRVAWSGGTGSVALKFIGVGLFAYLLGGLSDAITSVRGVAVTTELTLFNSAQAQLALYGAVSLILLGALYFAVPRIAGRPWPSGGLIRAHFGLSILGLILLIGGLAAAGLKQGADINNAKIAFDTIASDIRPGLIAAAIGQAALLLGSVLLALNFLGTSAPIVCEEVKELLAS